MRRTCVLALVAALAALPAVAAAQGDEQRARELLNAVEEGDRGCGELEDGDFESIGEYVMARMAGGTEQHDAMDQMMRSMMGGRGAQVAHEQMGRRFAGCGGVAPAGMMGMMVGGGFAPGMMGGDRWTPGYRRATPDDDDGWSAAETAMVVMMALLLLVVAGLAWFLRPRRDRQRADAPLDVLARRFAAGEIDQEEHERRRRALGGTG